MFEFVCKASAKQKNKYVINNFIPGLFITTIRRLVELVYNYLDIF